MKKHTKKGGKIAVFVLIFALLAAVGFWYFETYTLTVTSTSVYDERINSDVKFVQITDLHSAKFGSDNKSLINLIDKQNPDAVFVTGDMFTNGDENGRQTAANLLSALAEKYDVYFINGEHDGDDEYIAELKKSRVHVMNYETQVLKIRDNEIRLYGINNQYYSSDFDLHNKFDSDSEHFSILLAHSSYFEKFREFGIDLSVCGDSHGGQIRLPALGAVYNQGIWFPETMNNTDSESTEKDKLKSQLKNDFDAAYTKGLYERNGKYLFISSGLGNSVPIRLFNRPEIAVITLKHKNG